MVGRVYDDPFIKSPTLMFQDEALNRLNYVMECASISQGMKGILEQKGFSQQSRIHGFTISGSTCMIEFKFLDDPETRVQITFNGKEYPTDNPVTLKYLSKISEDDAWVTLSEETFRV